MIDTFPWELFTERTLIFRISVRFKAFAWYSHCCPAATGYRMFLQVCAAGAVEGVGVMVQVGAKKSVGVREETRTGLLLDACVAVKVAEGTVVCVEESGENVLVLNVGKVKGCGVVVENFGSKVGTVGNEGMGAVLFRRTNITATPISKSMIMIASAMIRPT